MPVISTKPNAGQMNTVSHVSHLAASGLVNTRVPVGKDGDMCAPVDVLVSFV